MPRIFPAGELAFIPDGSQFFQLLFDALSTAHFSICLEYYKIRADQTGIQLAEILSAACRRGVKVYLIYDYIGCLDTPETYFRTLRQNGIHCMAFNPPSFKRGIRWFDRRDHRKVAIIDEQVAFLGGRNIGNEYADVSGDAPLFYDVGFTLSGPAVPYLSHLFAEVWAMEQHLPPDLPHEPPVISSTLTNDNTTATITLISGGPHQRRSVIRSAFRVAMATASSELLIANPYFLPGPLILRSLLRAARRGVKIRLLLPAESDVPIVRLLSRGSYEPLLHAGIEIYEMQQQLLHAKLMLIDGTRTVIGSANMDQRSFHRNYEINAHIQCQTFSTQVRTHLLNDFSHAHQITLDSHARRKFSERLMERLLRPLSWFL
jgi:cardiolipin synthase